MRVDRDSPSGAPERVGARGHPGRRSATMRPARPHVSQELRQLLKTGSSCRGDGVVRGFPRRGLGVRGRTRSHPVVRKTARSYLRAPLKYDRAPPGTTTRRRDAEPPAPAHPDHALTHEEPQNIAADTLHTSAWRASAAGPIAQDPTRASDVYPATRERRRGRRTSTCGAPGRRRLRRRGRTANRRLWIRR